MKRIKFTLLLLIVTLFYSCQKKPIIIGDFNGENRVTFEQLRENPEPYIFKEISFEVGDFNIIQHGVDVTSKEDRTLVCSYKERKYTRIEKIIEAYENGDTAFLPDGGNWNIYYNSILPIQLETSESDWKHLENRYTIPEQYIKNDNKFIYTSENTDSLIFSGVLFESRRVLMKDSLRKELKSKYKKEFSITYNRVYLTGIKIIPR
ncbi:MAG TPA: hypothetical protein VKY57_09345 [Chitinispirillaceae bacterium]|nr:hypothetical protein [Fibrobacter sp.]HLV31759.1 hypothetical protein [Chitinispirillaceae bacterium]